MNYACAPLAFVLGGSVIYYYAYARKYFHGPGKSQDPDPYLDECSFVDSASSNPDIKSAEHVDAAKEERH